MMMRRRRRTQLSLPTWRQKHEGYSRARAANDGPASHKATNEWTSYSHWRRLKVKHEGVRFISLLLHPAEDSLSRDSIYVFVISVDERFFQRVKTRSRAPVPHDFHTLWCIFSDSRAALIQSKSSLSQTGHVLLSFKPSLFWTAAPCKLRVLKKMIGSLYTKTRPAM